MEWGSNLSLFFFQKKVSKLKFCKNKHLCYMIYFSHSFWMTLYVQSLFVIYRKSCEDGLVVWSVLRVEECRRKQRSQAEKVKRSVENWKGVKLTQKSWSEVKLKPGTHFFYLFWKPLIDPIDCLGSTVVCNIFWWVGFPRLHIWFSFVWDAEVLILLNLKMQGVFLHWPSP